MYVEGQSMGSGPWSIKIYADDKVFLDHRTTDALNLALEIPLGICSSGTHAQHSSSDRSARRQQSILIHSKVQLQN